MKINQKKFLEVRNQLVNEVVEEMVAEYGEEAGNKAAYRFFEEISNREAIEEIARHRVFWTPTRDLSLENFRKNKWRNKRDDETPEMA
jgi:hypothetical protein